MTTYSCLWCGLVQLPAPLSLCVACEAWYERRKAGLPPDVAEANAGRAWPYVPGPTEKRCRSCGLVKPRDEFYIRKRSRDTLQSWCKPCCRARRPPWRPRKLRGR